MRYGKDPLNPRLQMGRRFCLPFLRGFSESVLQLLNRQLMLWKNQRKWLKNMASKSFISILFLETRRLITFCNGLKDIRHIRLNYKKVIGGQQQQLAFYSVTGLETINKS